MGRAAIAFGTALLLGAAALSSPAIASGTPDLELTLVTTVAAVSSGQPLTYYLTARNLSAADSATNVTVVDTLPTGTTFQGATAGCTNASGVVTCAAATLAASASVAYQITVLAPITSGPPSASLVDIVNTATVSALEPDPNAANNTRSVQTRVYALTDLAVAKTGPATASPGSTISFAISVRNLGPSAATWVLVYDPLPQGTTAVGNGMTSPDSPICGQEVPSQQFPNNPHVGDYGCRFTSIPAGGSVSMTFTVLVGASAPATLSNTATAYAGLNPIESADFDPDLTNNAATATVTVVTSADVAIIKSSPAGPVIAPGSQFSYTLSASNLGPHTASNVVITDPLPAGVTLVSAPVFCNGTTTVTCAIGDLPAGVTTQPFTLVVRAPSSPVTITNTASVTSSTPDPNTANNSSSITQTVRVPTADLSVTKTAPNQLEQGVAFDYAITVHNNGPDTATNIFVTDALDSRLTFGSATWRVVGTSGVCGSAGGTVTCLIPTLAALADAAVTLTVTPTASGAYTNTASVSANEADPFMGDNSASVSRNARARVDLSLSKTDVGGMHVEGGTVLYSLRVVNAGPGTATGVTIVDTLPPGTSFKSGPPACTPILSGAAVRCALGTLAPAGATSAVIELNVNTTGTITNTATVTTSDVDTNPANDTASVTTTIIRATDLAVTETAARGPGGTAVFTTVVTNNGPSTSNGAVALNTLPAAATAPSIASPAGVVCDRETVGPHAGQYGCRFGAIAAGASVTMTFTFQPPAGAATTSSTVTAYPGSGEFDLNGANDSETVTLALDNTPAGTNVPVTPTDTTTGTTPVRVTFTNVTAPGTTSLTTSPAGPPPPAGFTGFQLGTTYYDLHTTATFAGTVRVCISDPSVTASTRLFHYETNPTPPPPRIFVDRTVLPVTPPTICADVTSFSIFAAFVDATAPTITIGRPSGTYFIGESVPASYTCADAGTSVATCAGTRANGAAIDTSSVGTKTFTVDATDRVGNAAHQTVTYGVGYRICSAPPRGDDDDDGARILLRICDAAGADLSSATIAVTALTIDGGPLPRHGRWSAAFRFIRGLHAYAFVVPEDRLASGTHALRFTVAGDPVEHTIDFVVRD